MNVVWCLILLATYIGFVIFSIKGGSMFVGSLIMGVIWTIVGVLSGSIGADFIFNTILTAPTTQGETIVTIFFGSWFGMLLVESGIAPSIIRRTIELSGDRIVLTNILLCIVTALIFSSCFGPGPVMAIAVIVLPIFLAIGIPKTLALCSFIISVGAGMYINPTFHAQIVTSNLAARGIEDQFDMSLLTQTGYIGLAVQIIVVAVMIIVTLKIKKPTRNWAVQATADKDSAKTKMAPIISYLTPLIPLIMIAVFNWGVIASFLLACTYGLLTCGKIRSYKDFENIMNRTFCSGVESVAPMMGFLLCQTIFVQSANGVSGIIADVLGGIFPSSYFAITILFIILIPFGLFRGPSTLCGTGTVLLTVLLTMGFAPQYIITVMLYISIGTTISCCPTQSWSIWAIGYTKTETKDFLKTGVPWAFAATAINIIITYFLIGIHM